MLSASLLVSIIIHISIYSENNIVLEILSFDVVMIMFFNHIMQHERLQIPLIQKRFTH